MVQLLYPNISQLTNSPWFQPQALSGMTAEVIREFTGLQDLLSVLPVRGGEMPFTFTDEIRQNILTIAPKVSEAQDTPLDVMSFVNQVFVAYESRMGYVLSNRNIDKAPVDLAQRATRRIGRALANRCFYEAFKTFRSFDNTYTGARFTGADAPATPWNVAGSDPLGDIERPRVYIENLTGQGVTFLAMSSEIASWLSLHPDITDKNRNVQVTFGPDGRLTSLKGMKIIVIPAVQFIDPLGNTQPMYPDVLTLDSTTWHNYVIFGVGGPDLGYTGIASSNGGQDRMAPIIVRKEDDFNRRMAIMGYLEMVHVIQDWYNIAIMNNVIAD